MGLLLCLLGLSWLAAVSMQAIAEPWVLVDTKTLTLTVLEEDQPVEVFSDIALGRNGAGIKRSVGDDVTPLGVFRIGWLNKKSRFSFFMGLDYPNLDYAARAYQDRLIDTATYQAIRRALGAGRTPPQDTPLGGFIGIHGIGDGDPRVHAAFHWTRGCIALDNRQIRRLARWVRVGTRVEIR